MTTEAVLQHCGRHVLAARSDDDFLATSGDREVPGVVERTQVATANPAVFGEGLGARLGVVVVAPEDVRSGNLNLAVGGDANLRPGVGGANGPDPNVPGQVHGCRRRGLGHAVPLKHGDSHAPVEMAEAFAKRSSAGHGVLELAAHRGDQLVQHQLVSKPQLGLLHCARPRRGRQSLGVADGSPGGEGKDLLLHTAGCLLGRRVVDLLKHAGNSEQEGGLEGLQVRHQVGRAGRVAKDARFGHTEHLDEPGKDVRQRHEQQGAGAVGCHHLAEIRAGAVSREVDEVAVQELNALGAACRPRRVDDGGKVGSLKGRGTVRHLGGINVRSGGSESGQAGEGDDLSDTRHTGLAEARRVLIALHEGEDGARILRDPGNLLGGGGLVDRNGHAASRPDCEVDQRPLVAGTPKDGDDVARVQSPGHQAAGQIGHLTLERRGGHGLPGTSQAPFDDGQIRMGYRAIAQRARNRDLALVLDDGGGGGNLRHSFILPGGRRTFALAHPSTGASAA